MKKPWMNIVDWTDIHYQIREKNWQMIVFKLSSISLTYENIIEVKSILVI